MEFCPLTIIKEACEHHHVTPEQLLNGLLRALASYHIFGNAIFPQLELQGDNVVSELNGLARSIKTPGIDDEGKGMIRSVLEAASMAVGHDYNRNLKRLEHMKDMDDPNTTASEFFDTLLHDQIIDHQQAMYMVLKELMNEAEKFALANALGEVD